MSMSHRLFLIAAARPNFMKVAPIWKALQEQGSSIEPVLIHTGQHYDHNMSDVFFDDLGLPQPAVHLGVGGGTHAEQTAGVLLKFEALCFEDRPDAIVVVGDVNATMATSLVAAKLHIPVAHVEAGLRSRDMRMPEEVNRLMTDAISDLLFTPSPDAGDNLRAEGVAEERIHFVGNVMIDSLITTIDRARGLDTHTGLGLEAGAYGVVTLHRPSNVDHVDRLERLLDLLCGLELPLVFPVHPRTRAVIDNHGLVGRCGIEGSNLQLLDPLGYYDFMNLISHAKLVLTDSGGLQEETTFLGIPCLTMRPNTERPITVTEGTNELTTLDTLPGQVASILQGNWKTGRRPELWDGKTACRIVEVLERFLDSRS
jgi:UDP-N-acetylglucosamine 2-epimerase (non-hydrolysing)